jgi:hypothetical protein
MMYYDGIQCQFRSSKCWFGVTMGIKDESSDSATTIAPTNVRVEFIFIECSQLFHGPIRAIVFLSGKFN